MSDLREGWEDPANMLECLSEADHALRMFQKIARKTDTLLSAQLSLLPLHNFGFVAAASHPAEERDRLLNWALGDISTVRCWLGLYRDAPRASEN
jgi:hypothetical protein